jgi:hypothetical protein
MNRNLLIPEFLEEFSHGVEITTSDVRNFYRRHIDNIKDSTVGWKIFHLIRQGIIIRTRIGKYHIVG